MNSLHKLQNCRGIVPPDIVTNFKTCIHNGFTNYNAVEVTGGGS